MLITAEAARKNVSDWENTWSWDIEKRRAELQRIGRVIERNSRHGGVGARIPDIAIGASQWLQEELRMAGYHSALLPDGDMLVSWHPAAPLLEEKFQEYLPGWKYELTSPEGWDADTVLLLHYPEGMGHEKALAMHNRFLTEWYMKWRSTQPVCSIGVYLA